MEIHSSNKSMSESKDMNQSEIQPGMPQSSSSQEQAASDIAMLAYVLWEQRGCPVGSPEQDWMEAEQKMRASQMRLMELKR